MSNYATIDVGYNQILILIAKIEDRNIKDVILDKGEITKLGEGVNRTGYLKKEAMRRSLNTLRDFRKLLDENNVEWKYETKTFYVVIMENGYLKDASYTPDFYLPNEMRYVEIKGYDWEGGKIRFEAFKSQYPFLEIDLINESGLKKLGVLED